MGRRPRRHGLLFRALADPGFTGLDPDPDDAVIITGYKVTANRKLTPAQRQARPCPPPAPRSSTASATSRTGASSPGTDSTLPRRRSSCALCSFSPASTPTADRRS
ncbi:MAG TPA: hypothetical protein VF070_16050 [Streptosporangiaceae bacterium]